MSEGLDIEKLRELLEREIEQLEERLQLLQQLLAVLEECAGSRRVGGELRRGREFRNREGRVVARIVESRDTVMLAFTRPVPETLPYIKYVLNVLERLRAEEGVDYSVEKREGGVVSILVTGVDKGVKDDVVAALEYAAMKLSSLG
ncbi:hypothetical protein [Hyperthermus butylicus]|uniref:Uncharacterized protein n=1 Tax=Hyperthermus butylicus (strain DSM 5456 / JCM 9403 / PLM1-5) TaxID=415426 RepID=A2BJ03_HYPBU|nr:hypothetical protein [Hyperthermus butylicus]ABM79964.1 hypothetical protein Hbut_0089 [Hyperthermus butylicus DSM 5456]